MECIGLDIGNNAVKAVASQTNKVKFLSHACPGRLLDLESAEIAPMDNLFVRIGRDGRADTWFIGEMARREGGTREYIKDKTSREYIVPLALTAIALLLLDEGEHTPYIAIGAPINDVKRQAAELTRKLAGEYYVQIYRRSVKINIREENVLFFPEGLYWWDRILGWDGETANPDIKEQRIAAVDPGWKTINFAVMDRMRYIDRQSGTIPNLGMAEAYREFFKRYTRDHDVSPNEVEERFLRDGGRERRALAKTIEDHLRLFWPSTDQFDAIYMGGGGEAFRDPAGAGTYFKMPVKILEDAQFANARIFYKVAMAEMGK